MRIGSSNRQADPHLIAELRRQAAGETFDAMPMSELSLNDLDLRHAATIRRKRAPG